jgi:hypothetical protein
MDLIAMVEARGNFLIIMVTVIMEIKDLPHSSIIFPGEIIAEPAEFWRNGKKCQRKMY